MHFLFDRPTFLASDEEHVQYGIPAKLMAVLSMERIRGSLPLANKGSQAFRLSQVNRSTTSSNPEM